MFTQVRKLYADNSREGDLLFFSLCLTDTIFISVRPIS